MRIGIVEPELVQREKLARLVRDKLGWQVLWEVSNGPAAIRRCLNQKPELILMALTLPGKEDGVAVTRNIMKDNPCAIVIITTAEHKSAGIFKALSVGALDAVEMPSDQADSIAHFLSKMKSVRTLVQDDEFGGTGTSRAGTPARQQVPQNSDMLIAIGCSTGGPGAVALLLAELPVDLPAAVVIVQHVDEEYASGMAEWLNSQIPMPTRIIQGGEKPEAGTVLLAKTNDHLVMDPTGRLAYTREPVENPYRPSVDEFFCSAGQYWRDRMMAVLLTGMGRDGGRGLLALRRLGYHTFAQNEASCAVYGMPQDAIQRGAADDIMTPQDIGRRLREVITLPRNGANSQGGRRL
ncbi:chemotaxis-specific protein-glutamate methyltransferase CheB [Kistimonas asteriae]|uniref:chemotaxis-specific protein-glutamate methyltransferase CheB n=1 Tax=Kistimonas asteriae TaxID=517724 RepID=UPI001BAC4773|nr:chemotaxis-specific protein-glutamate methyltransferase CheB [Kistimonas asteriae]